MKRKSVSVAMAAYNGQQYIQQQIESILKQLHMDDELLVSLDFSTDNTEYIVQKMAKKDDRIQIVHGPSMGVLKNFENAINLAKNEILFLSDQDDVWLDGKVERILQEFEDDQVQVVMHDAAVTDENLHIQIPSIFKERNVKLGVKENILKNGYRGCCMAFRQSLKDDILPFPKTIPMHDQWIGLVGELTGKNVLVPEVYLLYRRHSKNETDLKHAGILQMLRWRKDIYTEIEKFKKKKGLESS